MFIFTPGNIGALWPDHITYDKANQLVSSECNGKITKYEYDAAGRLVKEGKRSYSYSWLDKVSSVKENGVEVASFTYHMDGQIATAKANGRQENFLWDNLALISRNETEYVNEPYVTGGNPILADEDVLFNDLLGSTIGIRSGKEYRETGMTAFGETDEKSAMFTGKPYIGELGYAFLFRNYRDPAVILLMIPLIFIGVVLGLAATGKIFNFFSLLGLLGLVGMNIKNAVVLVEQIGTLRREGRTPREALVEATRSRIVPVTMASGTTILGMLPLLFDSMFGAMAATIMGGLLVATLLTICVLPVVYALFYRIR